MKKREVFHSFAAIELRKVCERFIENDELLPHGLDYTRGNEVNRIYVNALRNTYEETSKTFIAWRIAHKRCRAHTSLRRLFSRLRSYRVTIASVLWYRFKGMHIGNSVGIKSNKFCPYTLTAIFLPTWVTWSRTKLRVSKGLLGVKKLLEHQEIWFVKRQSMKHSNVISSHLEGFQKLISSRFQEINYTEYMEK